MTVAKLAVVCTTAIAIIAICIPRTHGSVLNRHARATMMIDMRGFPDPGGLCRGAPFYRNTTDCTQFYRCVDFNYNGKYTVFRFMCGPMSVFDERMSLCVAPRDANPPCPTDESTFPPSSTGSSTRPTPTPTLPPSTTPTSSTPETRPPSTTPTSPTPTRPPSTTPTSSTPETRPPSTTPTSSTPETLPPSTTPTSSTPGPLPPSTTATSSTPETLPPSTTPTSSTPGPLPPSTTATSSTPETLPPSTTPTSPTPTLPPSTTPTSSTPETLPPSTTPTSSTPEPLPSPTSPGADIVTPSFITASSEVISSSFTPPLTSSIVTPTNTPVPEPVTGEFTDSDGRIRTTYIIDYTTYTKYFPVTKVDCEEVIIKPGDKIKLEITTTVQQAFGTVTTIYGQDGCTGLEPSVTFSEGGGSIAGEEVNTKQGVTVVTQTQVIGPVTQVQPGGKPTTLYSTVRITRTLAPTLTTTAFRLTTFYYTNQVVTTTLYQTLILRIIAPGYTYYNREVVTVINDQTATQTFYEPYTPLDINPNQVLPYITTTIVDPSLLTINGETVTQNLLETVTLQQSDILTFTEPSPPKSTVVTYLNPEIVQNSGQLVTATFYRIVTLYKYRPTLATIVRPVYVTISGDVQTTTRIQTVTLEPSPGQVTSIVKTTPTVINGIATYTSVVETYYADTKIIQEGGGELFEIESSKIEGITGDVCNLKDGSKNSVPVALKDITTLSSVLVTYIQGLTLNPQVSTRYQTLTVTRYGKPVTVTVQQTIKPSPIVSTILKTTQVVVNSDTKVIIDTETVGIPLPARVLEPTIVLINGTLVSETLVQDLKLKAGDLKSFKPSSSRDSITRTYLNPDVLASVGEVVAVTRTLKPYFHSSATVLETTTTTELGQIKTKTQTRTVTLLPTLPLTSITKTTTTINNGLETSYETIETYLIRFDQGKKENLYEIQAVKIGELLGNLKDENGIEVPNDKVEKDSDFLVTYIRWLTLLPQISTTYPLITITQNSSPVTVTALQTIQPTPITRTILTSKEFRVDEKFEMTITEENQSKTFTFGKRVPTSTTSTTVVVATSLVTPSSEQTVSPSTSLTGSISTMGVGFSSITKPTPPLSSSAVFPASQSAVPPGVTTVTPFPPVTTGQVTRTQTDGSTTYVIYSPITQALNFVEPGQTIPVQLTTTVVRVDGVVSTIYGQDVGPGLDSTGPIIGGGSGLIQGQSADIQQGITTITETQFIKPTEVVLPNGTRTTLYGTVRVTRTLAPHLVTTIITPTTIVIQGQAVTNTILQTVTLRPIRPSTTYMVYTSTFFNFGQQFVSTITGLYTTTQTTGPSPPVIRPTIVETVFATDTFFINGQLTTASILETVTLDGSFQFEQPSQTFPTATATGLTYLNPSAVLVTGQVITSTLFQTLTLKPFQATSVKVSQLSTVLIGGQLVISTITRTVTRAPTAGFLTSIVKPGQGAFPITLTYVIEPTQVSSQGDITEVINASVVQIGQEFTNLVYDVSGILQSSKVIRPVDIRPGYILSLIYEQVLTLRPLRAPVPRPTTVFKNGALVTVTLWETLPALTQVSTVIRPTTVTVGANGAAWVGGQWFTFNHILETTIPKPANNFITEIHTNTVTENGQEIVQIVTSIIEVEGTETIEPSVITITDQFVSTIVVTVTDQTFTETITSSIIDVVDTQIIKPTTTLVTTTEFYTNIVTINGQEIVEVVASVFVEEFLLPVFTTAQQITYTSVGNVPSQILTETTTIVQPSTVVVTNIVTSVIDALPPPVTTGPGTTFNPNGFTGTTPLTTTPKPPPPTVPSTRPPSSPSTSFQLRCGSELLRRFPIDCSKFYQCFGEGQDQVIYVFGCVIGSIFDEPSQQCRLPKDTTSCYTEFAEEEFRSVPTLDTHEGMVKVSMEKLRGMMEASREDHLFPKNVPLGPVALAQYLRSNDPSKQALDPVEPANTHSAVSLSNSVRFNSGSGCDNPDHNHGYENPSPDFHRSRTRLTPSQRLMQFDFGRRLEPRMRAHFV